MFVSNMKICVDRRIHTVVAVVGFMAEEKPTYSERRAVGGGEVTAKVKGQQDDLKK